MVANGGFEVAFHGEHREIVRNERMVTTEVFEGGPEIDGDDVMCTYTFTEVDECTTLTLLVDHPSQEIRDLVMSSGMEAGIQEAMDHLGLVATSLR